MDAIERRDFIKEQEACERLSGGGGCLLSGTSLIINRTNGDEPRLNLNLIRNPFSQHQSANKSLSTTPTSSRRIKRVSRLGEIIEASSSQGLNLSKRTADDTAATGSSADVLESFDYSDLVLESKHKQLPFYPNYSNDSSLSDNNNPSATNNDASCSNNQLDAESPSLEDESPSNLCPSCTNDARDDTIDADYEEDDEDVDGDGDIDDDAEEEMIQDLAKPSTSNSTATGNAKNSECCECTDDHNRSRFDRHCSVPCKSKDLAGIDLSGAHGSGASTSYRSRTMSGGNMGGQASAFENIDDANEVMDAENNPCADWPCESNSDCEEICTCRDDTDDEVILSEDELPSRDVDLSCYSISEDMLNNGNSSNETPTSRVHRKRKLTETRSSMYADLNGSNCSETNDRKRLALENVKPNGNGNNGGPSQPTTPTTSSAAMMAALRTPRSVIPTRDNPPPELSDWLDQFKQWSHVERLMAVDRLIEHCEPTQVRHMMKVIEPKFQRDFISLLPKELALQVLSYLAPKDLLRAAQTCRSWRFLCDDNLLWKEKCKQGGICIEASTDRPKRGRVGSMPPMSSPWKAAYMRQHIIEMNWRSRPIRDPKILKAHDDHVITCLQFCGNRIVSGSDDNTLKVWSAITGKCLHTLVGHTGGVWSSQMANNIIISGSTDRTLKVWNADTGNCIHTLTGHTSTVRCMHLHEKKVVSGSRDATLRVWDIDGGRCLHTLVGHLAAVRCVQYDGKLVGSGAYDYMVKVWNPETEECLHTLQGHTNRVYSLQFDGVHVVSGSLDTSIRVWDVASGTCKHTLMGHQSLTSGMELQQNILVSGNADSTVKVWDTTSGQCLQTLSGPNKHQSAVTCLQFDSRFVITSSDDGTVTLWDVRTGEFIRNLVTLESGGSGGVVWKIRSNDTKLVCAVGSRNGTEETKLMVLDFDVEGACLKCS